MSDTGAHIVGEVETVWVLGSDAPVVVPLDSAMRVVRVLIDGKENTRVHRTAYGRDGNIVYIPHDKQKGDTLRTRIRYHGTARDGLVVRIDSTGNRTFFADNWPDRAHLWLPVQDHPSDKAEVNFRVEVPLDLEVIANGTLVKVDTLARNRAAWQYRLETRIPPSNFVFGAARMAVTQLTPPFVQRPLRAADRLGLPEGLGVRGPGLQRGPGNRRVLQRDHRTVPLSEPGARRDQHPLRRHGERHGDLLRRADVRRQETWARRSSRTKPRTSGSATPSPRLTGIISGCRRALPPTCRRSGSGTCTATAPSRPRCSITPEAVFYQKGKDGVNVNNPVTETPIVDTTATDLMGLLSTNNYPKGAWVLNELRGVVGDSAFFKGLQLYYSRYRNGIALSSDFETVMQEVSGQDLDWFFTQALMLPGYPMLTVRWTAEGRTRSTWRSCRYSRRPGVFVASRNWRSSVDGKLVTVDASGATTHLTVPVSKEPTTVDRGPAAQVAAAGQGRTCAVARYSLASALAACSGLPPLRHKFEVGRDSYVILVADAPDGRGDLWAMSPEGSDIVQLTFSLPAEWSPRLSPSGDVIAFLRSREQGDTARTRIWLLNLLNGSEREVVAARQFRRADGARVGRGWARAGRAYHAGRSSTSTRRRIRRNPAELSARDARGRGTGIRV